MLYHRINEILWKSIAPEADSPEVRNKYQGRLRAFYKAIKRHPNDWKKALNHRHVLGSLLFLSAELGNTVVLTATTPQEHSFTIDYNKLIWCFIEFHKHQIGTTACTLTDEQEDEIINSLPSFMQSIQFIIGLYSDHYCDGTPTGFEPKNCLAGALTTFLEFMFSTSLGTWKEQEDAIIADGFTRPDVQDYFNCSNMSQKHKRLIKEQWTYILSTHRPLHYMLGAMKAVGVSLTLTLNNEVYDLME